MESEIEDIFYSDYISLNYPVSLIKTDNMLAIKSELEVIYMGFDGSVLNRRKVNSEICSNRLSSLAYGGDEEIIITGSYFPEGFPYTSAPVYYTQKMNYSGEIGWNINNSQEIPDLGKNYNNERFINNYNIYDFNGNLLWTMDIEDISLSLVNCNNGVTIINNNTPGFNIIRTDENGNY